MLEERHTVAVFGRSTTVSERIVVVASGLLAAWLAIWLGGLGGTSVAAYCGLVAGVAVVPFSRDLAGELVSGGLAGLVGGTVFAGAILTVGAFRLHEATGELGFALWVGTDTAVTLGGMLAPMFAIEGMVAAAILGTLGRKTRLKARV